MSETQSIANETAVPCPKCSTHMALAAVIPHPVNTGIMRHTFVCAPCNQTRSYMLPAK
jgi:C4-type Zn-finger protein